MKEELKAHVWIIKPTALFNLAWVNMEKTIQLKARPIITLLFNFHTIQISEQIYNHIYRKLLFIFVRYGFCWLDHSLKCRIEINIWRVSKLFPKHAVCFAASGGTRNKFLKDDWKWNHIKWNHNYTSKSRSVLRCTHYIQI